jgi:hypothetical protein
VEDGIINLKSHGCESECGIVLANAVPKFASARSGAGKQLMEDVRRFRERWELNLALETAYTELWIDVGRVCEPFQLEMQRVTFRTLNIHRTQIMPTCRFMIGTTTYWKDPQGLIVIHDLLDVFDLLLLIDLLLLLLLLLQLLCFHLPLIVLLLLQLCEMSLILLHFHLPLLLLLLLQLCKMSLILLCFHLPLLLLLPLQFSQIGLMLLSFHLPLMLLPLLHFSQMSLMLHLPLSLQLLLQFSQVCLMLQSFLFVMDLPLSLTLLL